MIDTFFKIHEFDREKFMKQLNSRDPPCTSIFTRKMESNGKLPFLDTCILIKTSHQSW